MFLALCAELGTFAVLPIAYSMGLSPSDSASIAMVGGADGPMVLFTSLNLSKEIFVPITVVAYLYLGLTYGGYPYLVLAECPQASARHQDETGEETGEAVQRRDQDFVRRGDVRDPVPALPGGPLRSSSRSSSVW